MLKLPECMPPVVEGNEEDTHIFGEREENMLHGRTADRSAAAGSAIDDREACNRSCDVPAEALFDFPYCFRRMKTLKQAGDDRVCIRFSGQQEHGDFLCMFDTRFSGTAGAGASLFLHPLVS